MKTTKDKWYCPACRSDIIEGEYKPIQTLSEHVCDPNAEPPLKPTYWCSNPECKVHEFEIFWDWDGGLYLGKYDGYNKLKNSLFINGNDAPFGSFQRKANVEISGADLPRKKYLSPWWMLKIWQPMIVYDYTSNYNGDVLKKSWHFEFLRKNNHGGKKSKHYSIYVNLWGSTIKYQKRKAKTSYKAKNFDRLFDTKEWKKKFIDHACYFFIKVFYLKSYIIWKNEKIKS